MASSMLTGERRWASSRRGGMTVLGKVAVPKPINLPSQRLENHGLDPTVEIVPKGSLSWGSRPSSAGSNAWGTSALSPTTDGSPSSPSHLVGRPSSGGGTRPSTAGSEKAYDSSANAWGSNSRPSSASGVLSSNSSLTSLRPRSAETRPGSSQLSRFAEPLPETSGSRATTPTSERVGVARSAKDGFSLSSGDFPTLGSEKGESRKNTEPLDCASHGRPGSSSGGVTNMADSRGINHGHVDDMSRHGDVKGNSWRNDCPPFVEDGPQPSMERWHGEPHPYHNPYMAPPPYESWRGGPPVNHPGGVWYRGPPGPPPYGPPVAPGGFPMDPFPYYRQPIPPPGGGPHGHHPKNGDMYRPHMPDSYMHPGMPIRPGFYPGPLPYEGYYGHPMRFCSPNERDLPNLGMAAGPPVYNRHANHNTPDPNNSHPRSVEGRGPDQVEHGHPRDPCGNYKVLLKKNDGWNQNDEEKWGHSEKGILSKPPVQENAWGDDYKNDEDMHNVKSAPVEKVSSQSFEIQFGSNNPANVNEGDSGPVMENVPSPRGRSLIQKIEGLNAKARASGGRQDSFHREEPHERVQMVNSKANQSPSEANSDVVLERHYPSGILVPVSRDNDVATVIRSQESTTASVKTVPRRVARGLQSGGDHFGKGRFNGQETDGWRKKSDSHTVVSEGGPGSITNDLVEVHASGPSAEGPNPNIEMMGRRESVMSTFDPSDAQRAKMREIAKQRAIQLQKEEEERIREQKAKALAKLEELNRRSATANQGTENQSQKSESIPPHDAIPHKQEDSRNHPEPSPTADQSARSNSSSSNSITRTNEISTTVTVDSTLSSQNQLPTAGVNLNDVASHKTAPQVRELSKNKRVGNKQRQNVPPVKNSTQDSLPAGRTDVSKDHKDTSPAHEVTGSEVVSEVVREQTEAPVISDSQFNQKRKNYKSGKNKHTVEESIPVPKGSNLVQTIPESDEKDVSDLSGDANDVIQSSENYSLGSREDIVGRPNNSRKPQNSRKPRNSQGNRSLEKPHINDAIIWAPVKSHNKVEVTDQTSLKAPEPLVPSATGDTVVNNSSKTKRVEMERYVAKPMGKELPQEGTIQQAPSGLFPSVEQEVTDRTGGGVKTSQGSVESKHADGKHRQPRAHGASWRQRVSSESTLVQANTSKDIQTSKGLHQGPTSGPDEHLAKDSQSSVSDGWNIVNDSSSNSSTNHAPLEKGKRAPFKGHKGSGNSQNFDHKNSNVGSSDLQCPPFETSQTEKTISLKENRAAGDRSMSHWQPKSQGYAAHNRQGNKSHGSQNLHSEESKALKNAAPNQARDDEVEPKDGHNEPRPSSGYRKNPNYGGRFNRGHESRGDESSRAQEIKQHYTPTNRERQWQNSHYEYQPVGSHHTSSRLDDPGTQTEDPPGGRPRVGERGQNSRRGRGKFYGRQSGNNPDFGWE